jgi:hypothetical protein
MRALAELCRAAPAVAVAVRKAQQVKASNVQAEHGDACPCAIVDVIVAVSLLCIKGQDMWFSRVCRLQNTCGCLVTRKPHQHMYT